MRTSRSISKRGASTQGHRRTPSCERKTIQMQGYCKWKGYLAPTAFGCARGTTVETAPCHESPDGP
eukprot:6367338-Pyramimonas_sp.AAC.1